MLRSKGSVEVHTLEQDEEGELNENLDAPYVPSGANLLRNGVVNVIADTETVYGIKMTNAMTVPLHVWAFYFDCSDLSICEYSCIVSIGQ